MNFTLKETTIRDIQAAYLDGSLTCVELVQAYLDRISAYDQSGPALNAFVKLNPAALEEAAALDRMFAQNKTLVGPLHGIPVAVKDQAETKGIETRFGSVALSGYVPEKDATIITKMKAAGAIILGKTAMPDFATSWFGYSSVNGETKNPYDLDRDPGGSSAGTGAAIAANLATVGIGEDTGGSIRLLSSFNSLVGVRVTPGLISRTGLSPLVVFQDTPGPMGRTVTDTAILLDALVGYDPQDPYTTAFVIADHKGSYTQNLDAGGLKGARVGVLKEAFGSDQDPDCAQVNAVIRAAIEQIKSAGAEIVEVSLPDGLRCRNVALHHALATRHQQIPVVAPVIALCVDRRDLQGWPLSQESRSDQRHYDRTGEPGRGPQLLSEAGRAGSVSACCRQDHG